MKYDNWRVGQIFVRQRESSKRRKESGIESCDHLRSHQWRGGPSMLDKAIQGRTKQKEILNRRGDVSNSFGSRQET